MFGILESEFLLSSLVLTRYYNYTIIVVQHYFAQDVNNAHFAERERVDFNFVGEFN